MSWWRSFPPSQEFLTSLSSVQLYHVTHPKNLSVEELQEARQRRSDSDIDVDSVYLKLPLEGQQEIPFSVGLGALSLADVEKDGSVDTDMHSFDTDDVVVAAPERAQKDRLPTRPAR